MCKRLILLAALSLLLSCNSSDVKEAVDVADGVPRKTIDASKLGVNAFANDQRFGSIADQFQEVRNTLQLRPVRLLMYWGDAFQAGPEAKPQWGFYDELIASLPADMEAVIVLTGLPDWVRNASRWGGGEARNLFVDEFVAPIVRRYGSHRQVRGFQIWNEPNETANPDDAVLGFQDPGNYVEMLGRAHSVVKDIAPSKLVVSAATTAINQNYPDTVNYNRGMRDSGVQNFCDIFAIHYYGKQFENIVRPDGVEDFLNGLDRKIWVTESGARGVNEQLAYGEQVWPFLLDKVPGIERIFIYQFADPTAADSTYGLRNLTRGQELSDLYIWLRDR